MGSDGSGEDIVAGEINDAESTTVVHGGRPQSLMWDSMAQGYSKQGLDAMANDQIAP